MRWVLVEAADRVLPEIDAELADYALRELRGRGIDIRLGTTLEEVTADSARLSTGETLPTRTVVWTAGVAPNPSLRELSVPLDERGRVPVDEHLRVKGMDSVWAIGDCAAAPDPRGGLCPPTAQHAVRQGPVAARNIAAELGIGRPSRFDYQGQRGLRQPRPLQGGRPRRRAHLPRLPRLVDGAQLPHEPDPGRRPQGARGDRLDGQPALPARPLRGRVDRPPEAAGGDNGAMGFEYLFIAFSFGLATAIIGRAKGSSFWIWLLVGTMLPPLGLIAVILYRREKDEPERQCPNCHKAVKLYVQVCPRCGTGPISAGSGRGPTPRGR